MPAEIINEISEFLQKGRAKNVKKLVEEALEQGLDPKEILNDGLLAGMMIVGGKFKRNEVFVPEVLVAARAMSAGISILEPKLIEVGNEPIGKAVVGTVKGDLHDIGKNLVVMMLKGAGFEIYDLGTDVDADTFIAKAEEIDELNEKGLREKYIVMVGGAPVNDTFAQQIGADYYTADAPSAAEIAKEAVLKRKSA